VEDVKEEEEEQQQEEEQGEEEEEEEEEEAKHRKLAGQVVTSGTSATLVVTKFDSWKMCDIRQVTCDTSLRDCSQPQTLNITPY
jgi:hypothetical protein